MWTREHSVTMQIFGIILLVIGVAVIIWALNMNVTVTTDAQTVGGVEIPSQTVNNIGLMDDRRNLLIVGGLIGAIGVVLVIVGSVLKKPAGLVPCPYCAEDIRHDAVVCRYCGRDLARSAVPAHQEPAKAHAENGNCSLCHSPLAEGAKFCGECGAVMTQPPAGDGPPCPHCGIPAVTGDHFCRECGYAMT